MDNKNLFKEAIADAKAVREVALQNAKNALQEALTPKIQSMLSAKLQEMDNDDEDLNENSDDIDLSEILAELDEDETKDDDTDADDTDADDTDADADDADEVELVKDMTADDLRDLIKDVVNQEMGAGEEMDLGGDDLGGDDLGGDDLGGDDLGGDDLGGDMGGDDEIDLEELLAELDALDETKDEDELDEAKKKDDKKDKKDKKELDEAVKVIKTLRSELNEMNLLNAKLLYVNKLFKAKNLSESQKLKVISSFDKVSTIKEVKNIYEALDGVFSKKQIKESFVKNQGFASKASGNAPKTKSKNIVETDEVVSRWQKLAGIK